LRNHVHDDGQSGQKRALSLGSNFTYFFEYDRILLEIYTNTSRATNAHHPTPIQTHSDTLHLRTSHNTSITMVSPPPSSPALPPSPPSHTALTNSPTDGALQLPIPAASNPPHNLHGNLRTRDFPRPPRSEQGEILDFAGVEGGARGREIESVC
jgi:hypothetical protein